jgi:hypothetical protein
MPRILTIAAIAFLLTLSLTPTLQAEDRSEFGLGIVLGEPTGLNAQFYWNQNSAVDFTAAWSLGDWLTVAGDYQIYNYLGDAPREWRWYYGLGSYMTFPDDEDLTLGVRVPVGLKYHFPYSVIDAWAEVAPGIELLEDTQAILHGGIGLTFWLK